MSTSKRRILGYVRVSTGDQAGGIETQKQVIISKIHEVEEKFPTISYEIVDFIIDENISGDSDILSRDGFNQMVSLIKTFQGSANLITEIWVQSRDRIARDVDLLGYATYTLKRLGCIIQDCTQDVALLGKEDTREKLLTRIFDALSEQELSRYREKARLGRERRVKSGQAITRPPLGYRINPETKKIVVDETKKQIVREIFEAYFIHNILPSQLSSHYKLSRSTIYNILKNKIYTTGEIKYGRFKQHTEPICSDFAQFQ